MSNQLELFKEVLVTVVTHDNTIVAGRIGADLLEVVAVEGPSAHRADDMLAGIAEALNHDMLFGDVDELADEIVGWLPYASDGAMDLDNISAAVKVRKGQQGALLKVLDQMVDAGRIERTSDDTFYIRED